MNLDDMAKLINTIVETKLIEYKLKSGGGARGENNMDYKMMKKALFEIEMMKQKKDVCYLDEGGIKEMFEKGTLNTLSQDSMEFYDKEIKAELTRQGVEKEKAQRAEINDYQATIEQDKSNASRYAVKQNNNLPFQLRKDENVIKHEINMIVGQPSVGSFDYRKRVAKYLGCEYDETTGKVDYSNEKRVRDERLVQQDYEQRQAAKKNGGGNEGSIAGIVE